MGSPVLTDTQNYRILFHHRVLLNLRYWQDYVAKHKTDNTALNDEHPRIIKYFNTAIRKDAKGYYVAQSTDQVTEKVYFKYKETAIFVVDLKQKDGLTLILNTGRTARFNPDQLMVKNDSLFVRTKECLIKFSSQSMVKISRYLKEEEGKLMFSLDGKSWPID